MYMAQNRIPSTLLPSLTSTVLTAANDHLMQVEWRRLFLKFLAGPRYALRRDSLRGVWWLGC